MAIERKKKKIDRVVSPTPENEDASLDLSLRPKKLKDYVGQKKVKDNLNIFMEAAKKRKEPIEHVLLYGPPGLGKTTLANIIANEMGVNIKTTSGPAIEKAGDLGAILTNLEDNDVLFIDEIHRMNKIVEEVLYPAMEDYVLDIVIGKGPSAKSIRLDLPRFTIIGATTRIGLLSSPFRDRFGATHQLDFYLEDEIKDILERSSKILDVNADADSIEAIAQRARRTPRIANRLLKRVRDYAQVKGDGKITKDLALEALDLLSIDPEGLDENDRRILNTIIEQFKGGPVGIGTLAAATAAEEDTLEEVIEPFLLQGGFLARTPRGRSATEKAYKHLDIEPPENGPDKLL
ncbi:Holliday junction branch migration DNA helicase RuvB [Patescibacteria group bacterium]